jgi:hypothetical protein
VEDVERREERSASERDVAERRMLWSLDWCDGRGLWMDVPRELPRGAAAWVGSNGLAWYASGEGK